MTDGLTLEQEVDYLRAVVKNLEANLAEVRAELETERGGHWVMFDLWSRELPPPWRAWRTARRMGCGRQARRWTTRPTREAA